MFANLMTNNATMNERHATEYQGEVAAFQANADEALREAKLATSEFMTAFYLRQAKFWARMVRFVQGGN